MRLVASIALTVVGGWAAPDFAASQRFLETYCKSCHAGKTAVGGFRLEKVASPESFATAAQDWSRLALRVRNGEMPPKGSPAPELNEREELARYVEQTLRTTACASGIAAGPAPLRRLNRDEYTATVQDLLDIHLDIGHALPVDGAGGEGFDNAAETLFLSPLHSEKYMETAKLAMDFAAKEYKSRTRILVAKPGPGVTPEQAARKILQAFLPRAFRRPVTEAELLPYLSLYRAARQAGEDFEPAIFFALRGALVSPLFLFRTEPAETVDNYALASRLSYFLWGSQPDELLTDLAASGRLQDPEVLRQMARRMLKHDRSWNLARRFTEQWLHTRELAGDKAPDAKLFPEYAKDEELRGDIRIQPQQFFREILVRNLSLLNLIDSDYTVGTSNFSKHFGFKLAVRANASKQPQWVELPKDSNRGGLLGMPAVLAVSSYPYRTSPVLRGTWILDSLLGTPPPPPPANVPPLAETAAGAAPATVRERLEKHRANAVCASCHSRIDPLGFALENYDVIGRWRTEDAGKPVDNSGEMTDGTKIQGPAQLKAALLEHKDLFVRNLTSKLLGYALGRGLTLRDSCTVDAIVAAVKAKDYSAQALSEGIVLSTPFRQKERPKEKKTT
ncbi:MAG: DUF1588 domain-containing protein [bacterium]